MKKIMLLLGFVAAASWGIPSFAACNWPSELFNSNGRIIESERKEREHKVQAAQLSCPICFEDMLMETRQATTCMHIFHRACLTRALQINNRCPSCRREQPLVPQQAAGHQPAQQPQQLNNQDIDDLIAILQQPIVVNQQLQEAQQQNQMQRQEEHRLIGLLNTASHRRNQLANENANLITEASRSMTRSRNVGLLLAAGIGFATGVTNNLSPIGTGLASLAVSTSCGLLTAQHKSTPVDRRKELFRSSFLNISAYTSAFACGALLRYLNPFGALLPKLTWPSPK